MGPEDEDTLGRDDFYGYGRVNLNDALILANSTLPFSIDIEPESSRNIIRPASHEEVEVAIFGENTFAASRVNCATLGFGPSHATASECEIEDVNDDGIIDMVAEFQINETGIACGDTEATLIGQTLDGINFMGTDELTTIGCRMDDRGDSED